MIDMAEHNDEELLPALLKAMDAHTLSNDGKPKKLAAPSLSTIPGELLEMLVSCISQQALHALARTSSEFAEIATLYLYREPIFASTFRFAQVFSDVPMRYCPSDPDLGLF
jgi:hypothetical protein